jgi:hypothetical protein
LDCRGELSAAKDAQLRPVLLGLQGRRLQLAGQIVETVRVKLRWTLEKDCVPRSVYTR